MSIDNKQVMYYGTLPEAEGSLEPVLHCGHPLPRSSLGTSLSPLGPNTTSNLSQMRDK